MIVTSENFQISVGVYDIFYCPKCKKNDLKKHYKFCPHCGVELEFVL